MYLSGKIISAKTVPGMGRVESRRMVEGVNSSMIFLIYCKNFYKCHNEPPPNTTKELCC
jgi:hypothetical protein